MKTLILATIIKALIPLFLIFAIYMFFRGHNQPGGGFIGGLIATIPFMVHAIAFGSGETVRIFRIKPIFAASAGLLLATLSGVCALVAGKPFMTALWSDTALPFIGKPGTPILFDVGVFLIVFGMVLQVTFLLSEEGEE